MDDDFNTGFDSMGMDFGSGMDTTGTSLFDDTSSGFMDVTSSISMDSGVSDTGIGETMSSTEGIFTSPIHSHIEGNIHHIEDYITDPKYAYMECNIYHHLCDDSDETPVI